MGRVNKSVLAVSVTLFFLLAYMGAILGLIFGFYKLPKFGSKDLQNQSVNENTESTCSTSVTKFAVNTTSQHYKNKITAEICHPSRRNCCLFIFKNGLRQGKTNRHPTDCVVHNTNENDHFKIKMSLEGDSGNWNGENLHLDVKTRCTADDYDTVGKI